MIEELWYKNAVIYSLDLETFLDADGDGIGDFAGLIQRLEYLEYVGCRRRLARALPADAESRQRLGCEGLLRR